MTPAWFLFTFLAPPLAAIVAGLAARHRDAHPALVIALNGLMPGAGLAVARRPLVEVVGGVVFAIVCLAAVGRVEDLPLFVPIMAIGAVWASLHTPYNPFNRPLPAAPVPPPEAHRAAQLGPPPARWSETLATPDEPEDEEGAGYSVTVRCTECGASTEVQVLQHMAHCTFCGTEHLVIGHDDTLQVAVPERIKGEEELRQAVLDHYRYQHYLKLYRRHVTPLETQVQGSAPHELMTEAQPANLAVEVAEQAVAARADAFRARLESQLRLGRHVHFLAPYRHGMGTLYQAAFGRSRHDQEKALRFGLDLLEASTLATATMRLPSMGKLSYLRALVPAAEYGTSVKCLPLDEDDQALRNAYGDIDHRRLVKNIDVIRLGSALAQEVSAVVWRPWWITEISGPRIRETLLVDGAAGSVTGPSPSLNPAVLESLPAEALAPGASLGFLPMQCPVCGFEFPFEPSSVLYFCRNCHRVFEVREDAKHEVEYAFAGDSTDPSADLIPFWQFPLRLRTADGVLVTDLGHLKDGIDGRLDQIGEDAPIRQHAVMVPAIRCINSRLMAEAFDRLSRHLAAKPPQLRRDRFPLDLEPPTPFPVCIAEDEARVLAPLYLANVFERRDLARANVTQIAAWLFQARMESRGLLSYVPIPQSVTEPFRRYVGRFKGRALERARRMT